MSRIGVLAIQGDFAAHLAALSRLGIDGVEVRTPSELEGLDALIMPGGESGAHVRILKENGLWNALRAFHSRGGALWGTCAGLILLAKKVTNPDQESLGLIDIDVIRNGWGRQVDSFEADVPSSHWRDIAAPAAPTSDTLRLVFIRAPRITRVGPTATTLLSLDDEPVAVVQDRVLVTTFHPEMTGDPTVHRWFVERVATGRESVSRGV